MNVVKNLNLKVDESLLNQNVGLIEDSVLRALKRYENHPSIKRIERNVERRNFSFSFGTFTDTEQQLKNLNPKKASQGTDIPTRILKANSDLFTQFVFKNYNDIITTSTFPNILKHATVRPIYKKDSRNEVQNYRPVSILINLSKAYEKCLFNEIATDFDDLVSKYQCGFRKGFSSQQSLILLVEKWKKN